MSSQSEFPLPQRRVRHTPPPRGLTASQVKAYLKRYPNILRDDPLLLAGLLPPGHAEDETVRDLQRFVIERLQERLREAERAREAVMEAAQMNLEAQVRVHEAAVMLAGAADLDTLIRIVTRQLAGVVGVDAVCLCVEAQGGEGSLSAEGNAHGVQVLAPGAIDKLLGPEIPHMLRNDVQTPSPLFGPQWDHIRSEALMRLYFGQRAPGGLLAIGAGDPDMFHPDQGVDLLSFLARTLEQCLRRCLDLPPA
ncbi:MAG: DUF484 family protein [Alphaproteobacteria bacterium]